MRGLLPLVAALLLAPLAASESYADPEGDESIGFPPGPLTGTLGVCRSPAADVVAVSVGRDGPVIVARVELAEWDAPMRCGPAEGAWLIASTYLEVYTPDLNSSLNVVIDSVDREQRIVGDPYGPWRVSVGLYVENAGHGRTWEVPASELWQGDAFEVRVPAQGTLDGVPYDTTGMVMSGYVVAEAWTNWPVPNNYGGFPQRSVDRAEIPVATL